jgi:xanthine dehydrogenase accessory factor
MRREIWFFVRNKLASNCPVQLQIVTSHKGSSPGKTGAKMLLGQDGDILGTIGGGIMEHQLQKKGLDYLKTKSTQIKKQTLKHQSGSKNPSASGLLCAGTQTVCFINLFPSLLPDIEKVCESFSKGVPYWMWLSSHGIHFSSEHPNHDGEKYYLECLNRDREIFIFGDGHIGKALSRNLDLLDYEYHLFPSPENTGDLNEVPATISQCRKAYAIVVTSSADQDMMCLRALWNCRLAYCGIMGSRAKIDYIRSGLFLEETPSWHPHIHAPIGLSIGSETPSEIAVSISAELIAVMHQTEYTK